MRSSDSPVLKIAANHCIIMVAKQTFSVATAIQEQQAVVGANQQVDAPQCPAQNLPIELPLVFSDLWTLKKHKKLKKRGEKEERKKGEKPLSLSLKSCLHGSCIGLGS